MQQITVSIDAAGEVKVSAQGVKGGGCVALTRAIEEALGKVTSDQKTGEYFQPQTQVAKAGSGK